MVTKRTRLRNKRGAAIIGLVLSLLFFILFLGLFAFDATRAQMCQRELVAACDAASIAGTAMLTSYDTSPGNSTGTTLSSAQLLAGNYAHNMFLKQAILGKLQTNSNLTTSATALYNVSGPLACNDLVALGDPANAFQAVAVGDPKGRTVMVFCCYGYQPSFLSTIHIPGIPGFIPMHASSFAGIPQVDAVVVFDYSGSMDDFTSVLFVRREWYWPSALTGAIADIGCPLYTVVTGALAPATNRLSDYIGWNWTNNQAGSDTNVLPPQNLEDISSSVALNGAIGNPLYLAPQLRANPIFCTWFLGTSKTPVPNLSGYNPGAPQTTTAAQLATSPWFKHYYSPGGVNIDNHITGQDFASPPGNYKPVFVSWDGLSSLDPIQFCNQYDHRNCPGSLVGAGNTTTIGNVWTYGYPPTPGYCNRYNQASKVFKGVTIPTGSVSNYQWAYHLNNDGTLANENPNTDNLNFTDLVVNLVNPTSGGEYAVQPIPATNAPTLTNFSFSGFSVTFPADEQNSNLAGGTYAFDSLAALVEASRGNLDSTTNRQYACIDANVKIIQGGSTTTMALPVAKASYQLAYERLAMLESQPYATACDGAVNAFFYKMATLCDARFGFVGFSATADPNAIDNVDGASVNGGCAAYTGSDKNFESMGTSDGDSFYRSGLCMLPASSLGLPSVFTAATNTGNVMDLSTVIGSGSASGQTVHGYNNGSGGQTQSGSLNQTGFKVPRTCLKAASPAVATDPRLNMVSSSANVASTGPNYAPLNSATLTTGQSPYALPAGQPWGDVWSAAASSNIGNGVWNGRPLGGTYCDEALSTAYNSFTTNGSYVPSGRRAARKAIVFFTDGEPTGGIGGGVGTNATTVATNCQPQNIVMYTIGLNAAGNAQLQADQKAFLGDNLTNNSGQGLAYKSGNGGRFFPCSTGTDVRNAFASIARRLSQAQN
jgi:hypothetical protein